MDEKKQAAQKTKLLNSLLSPGGDDEREYRRYKQSKKYQYRKKAIQKEFESDQFEKKKELGLLDVNKENSNVSDEEYINTKFY